MTEHDNKAIVAAYLKAAFIDADLALVETFWGYDMIQHNPTMPNGHDVLRGLISNPDPRFKYEQGLMAAERDLVMVHGRYEGWGPKPMIAVGVFRVVNGKIVEHWDVMQEEVTADEAVNGHAMFPIT